MKIAHVTLYPPQGEKHASTSTSGVASYSKNLVSHLSQLHDDQTVICDIIDSQELYHEDSVSVRRVFRRRPSFVKYLHKELTQINPDVIHIQQELGLFGNIFTAYLLQWLVFFWRKKTVITLHGVIDPRSVDKTFIKENNSTMPVWLVRLAFRVIYAPLMWWAKKIIVHEEYFKQIAVEGYHIQADKIVVIPHGVEALQVIDQQKARRKLRIPERAKVALFMGYATGYKGLDLLIEGFSKYTKTQPDAYLVIGAGKHPKLHSDTAYLREYKRLQSKAAETIPRGQYVWHGFINESDITTYYSASDVSLYPYTTAMSSSGPMSFAIGYEKPFLVSSAFQTIFRQFPQLLFDRQPNSLAERLAYFFDHQEEYDALSRQLKYQRSWERVSEQTLQTYQSINSREGAYETEDSFTTG